MILYRVKIRQLVHTSLRRSHTYILFLSGARSEEAMVGTASALLNYGESLQVRRGGPRSRSSNDPKDHLGCSYSDSVFTLTSTAYGTLQGPPSGRRARAQGYLVSCRVCA